MINWKLIWNEFDAWTERENSRLQEAVCAECGESPTLPYIDWDIEQKAIERIVEKALHE